MEGKEEEERKEGEGEDIPRSIILDIVFLNLLNVMVCLRVVHAFGAISTLISWVAEGERKGIRTISTQNPYSNTLPATQVPAAKTRDS